MIDRRLAAGELVDHRAHLLHRRAFAEQPVRAAGLRLGRSLLRQVERRLDERAQLFERQRLRHVIERARLQCRNRVLGAAVRRDHRDRKVGAMRADVAHQLEAVAVRQPHVGEAEVEALALEKAGRLGDRSGALDPEAHADQGQLQQLADVGFVVDHEHRGLRCCAAFRPVHPRTPCQVIRKSRACPAVDVVEDRPVRRAQLASDVEAEAGARAVGREERLEQLALQVLCHAGAVVDDVQF